MAKYNVLFAPCTPLSNELKIIFFRGKENFFVSNFVKVKINSTADAALQQIEDKQYAKPFANTNKTIYKFGVNFSTETRRIDEWKIV